MTLLLRILIAGIVGIIFGYLITLGSFIFWLLPILIVISFLHPLIGITAWLVSEIFLGNYQIFGANPRTFIALIFGFYFFIRELKVYKGEDLKNIFSFTKIPLFILFLGISINIFLNTPLNDYFRWAVTFFSNIMTVFFLGLAINDEKTLRRVVNILIFLLGINALVGILQYIGTEKAYIIRQFLMKVEIEGRQGRVLGIARSVIEYAYVLQLGFALLLGMLFLQDKKLKKENLFLYVSIWLIGMALILNGTRTAIGGIFVSILFYTLFSKKILNEQIYSVKRIFAIFFIIFVLAFSTFSVLKMFGLEYILSSQQIFLRDISAIGRVPRAELALNVFIHNPLGVGEFNNYARKITFYWGSLGLSKGINWESFSVHNHFLRTFLYFGIIGGVLFILFILKLLKQCASHYRNTNNSYLKGIYLGMAFFIVAYCVNIFFHNAGPLHGDNLFWLFLGIIAASINFQNKELKLKILKNNENSINK